MTIAEFTRRMIFLLFFAAPFAVSATPPGLIFKNITRADGLSNSTIECIAQDSRGFIWIGTRDGLNKYDGYEMVVYKNNPKAPNSISDNYIRYIYEDREKNLWIGTSNGLNLFNPKDGSFRRFKYQVNQPGSLPNNQVNCIYEDRRNNLWISTYGGGLNKLDRKTNHFTTFSTGDNSLDRFTTYIYEDTKNNLWVATENGIKVYRNEKLVRQLLSDGKKINISVITEDAASNMWIGTSSQGLVRIDGRTGVQTTFQHNEKDFASLGSNVVLDVQVDRAGNVWVGCANGGLDLFNASAQTFHRYINDDLNNPIAFNQKTVSDLFEDNQGNLWIGTHRGGVKLLALQTQKFELFQQEKNRNGLSYNDVKAFYEDRKGNIWIGTDGGGLDRFALQTRSFIHHTFDPFNKNSISADAVLDITEDQRDLLWIATWGGGLNLYDPVSGKFSQLFHQQADGAGIASNYIVKLLRDKTGHIWIGTYYGGLYLLDPVSRSVKKISADPRNKTSVYGNNIISLNEDRKGNIWIGTDDGGLNCYDTRLNEFRHYFHNQESNPNLEVIFTDSKGRLWVGQSGLYLYDESKDAFNIFTSAAGLETVQIKGIVEDNKGFLWITTSDGLIRMDPLTKEIRKFNKDDGLQGEEFQANAILKTKDGRLYFGGLNGFNTLHPDSIATNMAKAPVYLTGLQIFNQPVTAIQKGSPLEQDINLAKTIRLNYTQSAFSISFAALNFTATNNNRYAYKLDGFDKDWNYIGHDREASYTNVPPGEYTFMVKAANNDGIWNEQVTSVQVIITPPFWKTTWFRLLIALLVIAAVYKILSFIRRREIEKLEKAKENELHQFQLQFFTNISHELRLPLTLILGKLETLMKKNPGLSAGQGFRSIAKNATRLMNLINELMDFRKVDAAAIKLKVARSNMDRFIDEVAEEFNSPALEKNITLNIKKDLGKDVWFDRQVLEKILLNLIHNSVKYTSPGGKIGISLSANEGEITGSYRHELVIKSGYRPKKSIQLKVWDTGTGISEHSLKSLFERFYRISESHLGSGIGLAFVKSLVLLHKGDIYVYSEKDRGTEIIITLPCSREDYREEEIWQESVDATQPRFESIIPAPDFPEPEQQVDVDALLKETELNGPRKEILVVDDSAEMRELIREHLSPYYSIREAADGAEGFEKAKAHFPDLVISDLMMPQKNGIDFCRALREDMETSHIPFLILTAKDTVSSTIEGIGSGADHYFSKPVSFNLLRLTIRNIFEQRQKVKEHYAKDHQMEIKELVHSAKDKEFMDQLIAFIDTHIMEPELDAALLCREMGMSQTKLYNKIKSITGQSIGEFIRTIRLRKAREIMTNEDVLITDVMFRVGMQTLSYFSRAFKKEFGKTPSQFMQEISNRAKNS